MTKHILIVEPAGDSRKHLEHLIETLEDTTLTTAASLEETVVEIDDAPRHFDLVIADLSVPGDAWKGILKKARDNNDLTDVIIYGKPDGEIAREASEGGAAFFIEKPCTDEEMLTRIRDLFLHQANRDEDLDIFRVDEMREDWLSLTAASDLECLERFRNFADLFFKADFDDKTRRDLTLAINELGQNAIEWGNRWDKTKKVHLSYAIFDDRIMLKIEDEGEGFNLRALGNPTIQPLEHLKNRADKGKRPGGYGVYMVRKLMDQVLYNERGNAVIMTKFLPKKS